VHGESEPAGSSALAPRSAGSAELAEASPFQTGGVGLYDHSDRDPFPRSAGMWAGATGLILTVILGGALIALNPAFSTGKAGGSSNQLGQAAAAGPELAPGSPAADGAALIPSKQCPGCHTIPGIQGANGTVGPNLAGVAGRTKIAGGAVDNRGPDDLKAWIMDPPGKKPGTAMPKLGLTDDEATKIAAYLETLK
jgi:cytochrome c